MTSVNNGAPNARKPCRKNADSGGGVASALLGVPPLRGQSSNQSWHPLVLQGLWPQENWPVLLFKGYTRKYRELLAQAHRIGDLLERGDRHFAQHGDQMLIGVLGQHRHRSDLPRPAHRMLTVLRLYKH